MSEEHKKAPKQQAPLPPPTPERAMMESAAKVQRALDVLDAFVKDHPYLIAPNVYKLWQEYLKETLVTLEQQHGHLVRAKEDR